MIAKIGTAVAVAGIIFFPPAPIGNLNPAQGTNLLKACATEDSTNCFWDAQKQGNGKGQSFHDINGTAYYACDGYEDAANCYWDATKQGNGKGRSFTDVNGVAIYWDTIKK